MINLQQLHQNRLSLRMSRNPKQMLGKVSNLSDDLKEIIKTLTYDGKIDKDAYKQLSIDDKEVFDNLLNKTGLVCSQKDRKDPKEALMKEYEKLAGDLEIGNDNPEIKKELKQILITMLAAGMVKEKRAAEILSLI